jgi:hypothetical protein
LIKKLTSNGYVIVSPKKWDGKNWVVAQAFKYANGKWDGISAQKQTRTWEANWSRTYVTDGSKRTDYRGTMLCQGKYQNDSFGHMRSLCGFNDASMRQELAGAKIEKVELYLRNEHWYYHSGGTVFIGYHNHANEPANFSHSLHNQKSQSFSSRGQAQWINMPLDFATGIRDNKFKGFSIFAASDAIGYYGVFYGANTSYKPKIKITYTK